MHTVSHDNSSSCRRSSVVLIFVLACICLLAMASSLALADALVSERMARSKSPSAPQYIHEATILRDDFRLVVSDAVAPSVVGTRGLDLGDSTRYSTAVRAKLRRSSPPVS